MDIIQVLGHNPRIEKPSRNYKKSFKRGRTRAERLTDFIASDDFQVFCHAEKLVENSLIQFCFSMDEEIRILFGGKVIWMDGMSYRQGLECMADVKAPKFLTRLTSKQQSVLFMATYWLFTDETGRWRAELLLGDDAFLQAATCKVAFDRTAQLFGGEASKQLLALGKIDEKETLYRFADLSLPDGGKKLLAISLDNGALFLLEPEAVQVTPSQKNGYEVYRTQYNWFRGIGDGNLRRID